MPAGGIISGNKKGVEASTLILKPASTQSPVSHPGKRLWTGLLYGHRGTFGKYRSNEASGGHEQGAACGAIWIPEGEVDGLRNHADKELGSKRHTKHQMGRRFQKVLPGDHAGHKKRLHYGELVANFIGAERIEHIAVYSWDGGQLPERRSTAVRQLCAVWALTSQVC